MKFEINCRDSKSKARGGVFFTEHGRVATPAFFPVATQAAVKGVSAQDLRMIDVSGLLVNAYHLFLRPGVEIIKQAGGLHKFMNFDRPIITDSGGYQVFSLANLRKVSDRGVLFNSHIDGAQHFLTPADIMDIQINLGADIIVPLDECVKANTSKEKMKIATERTVKWARVSNKIFNCRKLHNRYFWPIIQGGTSLDYRKYCLAALEELNIDGLAIGGLSVGENHKQRQEILAMIAQEANPKYVRYFMGHGKPDEIVEAVACGVDMFDCILPTRLGRTGTAFTDEGKVVIRNSVYARDFKPLDSNCNCPVCTNYTRAYLRHLINVKEMLGSQLLTYHNIWWYNQLMSRIRKALKNNAFSEFKGSFLEKYRCSQNNEVVDDS
jgi:queuine tRNA-ribosyltransferase